MNMAQNYQKWALLVARVLLVAVYFLGGFGLLSGKLPVEYAASKGMPEALVWVGYGIKLFAGLAVIIGLLTRLAVFGLIMFTLCTAFLFHPFPDPLFLKELSMIGGLVLLFVTGPGQISVESYFMVKKQPKV